MAWAINVEKIKLARYKKGLTLKDVADRSGVTHARLCQIEKGKCGSIRADTLLKICKALGIRVEDVISIS